MIIEKIWTANAYRNFNYLIACPETGEALAIDPNDHKQCLEIAKKNQWNITKYSILMSIGIILKGMMLWKVKHQQKSSLIEMQDKIPNIDIGVDRGDIIKLEKPLILSVWILLDIP